jgi:tRNA(Arg) A34 adenosine deaminase TadA
VPFPQFLLWLPQWVEDHIGLGVVQLPEPEDRLAFVIELARLNLVHGTGGPFGAAVFERDSGALLAPGVNLVVPLNSSIAHAEVVALTIAQQRVGHYDLGAPGLPAYELATSTEPCAMCLGAIPWSGVRSVACAAREEDARRIGFDEGAKPDDWVRALGERGIAVQRDVCRERAIAVLEQYHALSGPVYNARQGEGKRR